MKKEYLFELIGEVDEQKIVMAGMEYSAKNMTYPAWTKWASLAACFAVVAVTAFSVLPRYVSRQGTTRPDPSNQVVSDHPTGDTNNVFQPETDEIHISMENISVNEIEELADAARIWYDPQLYDSVVWDESDVMAYYGKDLTPVYIPHGLTAASGNGTATVVVDKNGEYVSDTVWFGFYHDYYEDGSPKLTEDVAATKGFYITASKVGLLRDCIYILPENEVQTSGIGGTEVTFGYRSMPYGPYDPDTHQPSGYYDMYVAEFECDGIEYQVVAEQMEEEEVVKVVSSMICGEEVVIDG